MKKPCLFILLIFSAVLTFAAPAPYAHEQVYDYIQKNFLKKFISNEEVTYSICIDDIYANIDDNIEIISEEEANNMFLEAIHNWLRETNKFISRSKGKNKLTDISDIMQREHLIKQVPCGEAADLEIHYTNNTNDCDFGKFDHSTGIMYISTVRNKKRKEYLKTLTHELGHTFGLADQYSGAIYRGSFLYNSKVKRPSIMDIKTQKVTCDDADGLITSIDRLNGTSRTFNSLCLDGLLIKNGQGHVKSNQVYNLEEEYNLYDAEIKVSYNADLENSYIIDITLTNFILNGEGISALLKMGFDDISLDTVKYAVVKIHGTVNEKFLQTELLDTLKTPIGLWTLVLYDNRSNDLIEKQIVTKDYSDEDNTFTWQNIDEEEISTSDEIIIIPTINLFPAPKDNIKEILRVADSQNNPVKPAKKQNNSVVVEGQVNRSIGTSLGKFNF